MLHVCVGVVTQGHTHQRNGLQACTVASRQHHIAAQVENGTLSVRTYAQGELGSVAVDELVALLVEANTSKRATISPPTPAP